MHYPLRPWALTSAGRDILGSFVPILLQKSTLIWRSSSGSRCASRFLVADKSHQKKIFDIAKQVTQYPRAAIMLLT
jgi:hypothetical protein